MDRFNNIVNTIVSGFSNLGRAASDTYNTYQQGRNINNSSSFNTSSVSMPSWLKPVGVFVVVVVSLVMIFKNK